MILIIVGHREEAKYVVNRLRQSKTWQGTNNIKVISSPTTEKLQGCRFELCLIETHITHITQELRDYLSYICDEVLLVEFK